MSITPNLIRQKYLQFKDPHVFTDAVIQDLINEAVLRLNPNRWGAMLDTGTQLFVAHCLTLKEREDRAARLGGVPGEVKGPLNSRSVSDVSNSWNNGAVTYEGAAFWNQTSYGIRFYQLSRAAGMGGIQI